MKKVKLPAKYCPMASSMGRERKMAARGTSGAAGAAASRFTGTGGLSRNQASQTRPHRMPGSAQQEERVAPSECAGGGGQHGEGERGAQARAGEDGAVGAAVLLRRQPVEEGARGAGEGAGFGHAEHEAHGDHRPEAAYQAR